MATLYKTPTETRSRVAWRLGGWIAGVGALIGGGSVLAAAFDIGPFAGPVTVYVLGYLLAAGIHGLAASLLLINPVAHRLVTSARTENSRIRSAVVERTLPAHREIIWFRHVRVGFAIGVVLTVVTVAVDVWVTRAQVGAVALRFYFLAAFIGVVLVATPKPKAFNRFRPELSADLFAGVDGVVFGAAFVVAVVIGSSIWRQAHLSDPGITSQTVPPIDGMYLALGDSYSAGEGLPPYAGDTALTGCHRSDQSYPSLLYAQFGTPQPEYRFQACSGAVTHDIYQPRGDQARAAVPAQVDGRVHPEVGLVTMSAGGNDIGFSLVVAACFKSASCDRALFKGPGGGAGMPPPAPLESWATPAIKTLAGREAALYKRLRSDFPRARIIVIGYPYLFPAGPAPWVPNDCASILRRFSEKERQFVRAQMARTNNMLYAEAVRAGIEFVSTTDAWNGHEPCGSKGQYTNSLKPVLRVKNPIDGGTFHPTKDGHRQLAALLELYLNTYHEPRPSYLPGHSEVGSLGADYCPSHLGLLPPFGQSQEVCP